MSSIQPQLLNVVSNDLVTIERLYTGSPDFCYQYRITIKEQALRVVEFDPYDKAVIGSCVENPTIPDVLLGLEVVVRRIMEQS